MGFLEACEEVKGQSRAVLPACAARPSPLGLLALQGQGRASPLAALTPSGSRLPQVTEGPCASLPWPSRDRR